MHQFYQDITNWLLQHAAWAGFFTFLVAFAESLIIVGTIVPGSITMTAVGIMMGSGVMSIPLSLSLAIAGAFIGDGISYTIGYRFRETLPKKWPFRLVPKVIEKGRKYFKKHGGKSVFAGRFIGAIRAMVPVIAGMMHMRPWQYFPISFCSAVLWAIVYLLPGFLIGYAANALPEGLAAHLILYLLGFLVVIWLIYWLAKEVAFLIGRHIDRALDQSWEQMRVNPAWRWLTTLIHNVEDPEHHGQFVAAVLCILCVILFITLLVQVIAHGPVIDVNEWLQYLARSLRNDTFQNIAIFFTGVADSKVLLPTIVVVSLYLWFRGHRYAAVQFFGVCFFATLAAWLMKNFIPISRPPGIAYTKATGSFPSGHTELATVIYGFSAWIIAFSRPNWRRLTYWLTTILIIFIILSRIYLGDHWFSDTLGATLLSLAFIFAGIVSYRRFKPERIHPKDILIPLAACFIIFVPTWLYFNFKTQKYNTQLVWQEQILSKTQWWAKRKYIIPSYRTNLAGQPVEVFNIQWAGNLNRIKDTLVEHGWAVYVKQHDAYHYANDKSKKVKDTLYQLELFPTKFDAKLPSLIVLNNHHSPGLVLRLWNSSVRLEPSNEPVWLGTLTYNKRPTSLLSHRQSANIDDFVRLFLPALKTDYRWKIMSVKVPKTLKNQPGYVLLIEPKTMKAE